MCPLSGELTVPMRYLLYITLCGRPPGRPHRVAYTRYRTDTVNSPDDGHMVAGNMKRIWFICKDYIRMQGQQSIK